MADLFQTIAEVFRSYHAWGLTNPFPCVLTFRKQSMYIAHCTLYIDSEHSCKLGVNKVDSFSHGIDLITAAAFYDDL